MPGITIVMTAGRRFNIINFIQVIRHLRAVIPGVVTDVGGIFCVHPHGIRIAVIGITVIIGVMKAVTIRAKTLAAAG